MKRIFTALLTLCILLLSFAGCSAKGASNELEGAPDQPLQDLLEGQNPNSDPNAPTFAENPFIATQEEPVSTFSADVDTASYAYFRKLINSNYTLAQLKQTASAFRTEEFINYFSYESASPEEGELFGVSAGITPCHWNSDTVLLRLTLQAEEVLPEAGNNLVFLIDVSGSMSSSDKLPLLKRSFSYLVSNLTEHDRVSIVTYSGKEEVILSGCPGNQGERILSAINALTASGSTNGEAGLREAYRLAADHKIENGNNRIIMASDGDLNVGISSEAELKAFVESKRGDGIFLSVLGFGTGNYRDANMEALADNGNGVYYYIDGESEAERIFCTNLLSTLYTVAKDVKLQLTFDPSAVSSYRLIGYENRLLDQEDFTDDTKDAGEVGAGHQVTVCYELTLTPQAAELESWMRLAVAYKQPTETVSQTNEYTIGKGDLTTANAETLFLSAVIETAMLLHNSAYLRGATLDSILETLDSLDLSAHPDRLEFRSLLHLLAARD